MNYLKLYELESEPFRNEPDPRFYFESATHARTRMRIGRAVTQHLGLAVLVGGPGCGKTTLAYGIEANLQDDGSLVRRVSVPRSEGDESWLLGRIASEFGVPERSADPLQALEKLEKKLVQVGEQGRHPVLLLDEAQMLRQPARMEDLRALLNLEHSDGRRVLTVVLFGLPELLETLERDPSLLQRVEIRQELRALTRDEAVAYLVHRLECAGGNGDLFTSEALDALAHLSKGVPRLLNSLADNALFEGALIRANPVDASLVAVACEAVGVEITGEIQIVTAAEAANMEPAASAADRESPEPPPLLDDLDDEPSTQIDAFPSESSASAAPPVETEPPDCESPEGERPRRAELFSGSLEETKTLDPEDAMFDALEADASGPGGSGPLDEELAEDPLPDLDFDAPAEEEAEQMETKGAGGDAADPNGQSQILGASSLVDEVLQTASESSEDESDSELDFDLELELDFEDSDPDESAAAADGPIVPLELDGEYEAELEPPAPAAAEEAAEAASEARAASGSDLSSPEAPAAGDDSEGSLDLLDSLFEGIQI